MPKILRIFNRCIIGGPVLNASYLTKYLQPEFETLLLMGEKDPHEQSADHLIQQLGISYVTVPHMTRSLNPLDDLKAYQEIRTLIKRFQPDIVHTHAAKPGALGRLAAASLKVPVVVHTFHGHVFHSYFNSFKTKFFINTERFLARKTDAIIAISKAQKHDLVDEFQVAPPEKFYVVPLGLDLDKFQENQAEKRALFRQQFRLEDDVIAIGIIGRLVPVKNHPLFLKAIKYVLQNSSKKIKAFIIGDGEQRTALERLAKELGIDFTTHKDQQHPHPLVFTSWRSDIDVINAGLDIITLCSFNEGTPVSLIEAQAADKPIVSTQVGGIADVVVEGETALLSKVNEEEKFCENLLKVVENDDVRERLAFESHKYVMEKFSYQRLMRDTAALYHELLARKKKTNAVLR